jgi:hypothetical protein
MFGIDDAIAQGSKLIDDVVTRIWPDATEVEKAKLAQATEELRAGNEVIMAQLKINEVEAGSAHWFVAAARPAAMWVGVFSLLYSGIGISILSWLALAFGLPVIPAVDVVTQTNLLYGLLGLGSLRTVEKIKDVATKKITK